MQYMHGFKKLFGKTFLPSMYVRIPKIDKIKNRLQMAKSTL